MCRRVTPPHGLVGQVLPPCTRPSGFGAGCTAALVDGSKQALLRVPANESISRLRMSTSFSKTFIQMLKKPLCTARTAVRRRTASFPGFWTTSSRADSAITHASMRCFTRSRATSRPFASVASAARLSRPTSFSVFAAIVRAGFASADVAATVPSLAYSKARKVLSRSGNSSSSRTTSLAPLVELQFTQHKRKFSHRPFSLAYAGSALGCMCSTARLVRILRSQKLQYSPRRAANSMKASR